jgi:hypothetical protein
MLRRLAAHAVHAVLAALVVASVASCGHEMSDREYCVRRQMGWEMAFPHLPRSESDRTQFIDRCLANVAPADARGELARSMACMTKHLVGHGRAYEQYTAFTACEQVDPTRER